MSSSARRRRGKVELATAQSIREIGELPRGLRALAEASLTLARALDEGAGLATAAVSRELRANLVKLAEGGKRDEDRDPFDEFLDDLSVPAEVGDAED